MAVGAGDTGRKGWWGGSPPRPAASLREGLGTPPVNGGRSAARWSFSALDLTATLIALLLAVPILSVIAALFGDTTTLQHLAATVLPEYIANTLALGAL